MLIYFRIADKYNIIDKPNLRSSHTAITIRGGGVVFALGMLLYYLLFGKLLSQFGFVLLGMWAISIVSFWDDVSSLRNRVRIVVHLLAVTALLYGVGAFSILPWWALLSAYILVIGTINAYNFMDGINGITGAYSLVVAASCWYINQYVQPFVHDPFVVIAMLSCLVFLFFNFRKKARCFAGDVGSVGIGFWIIALVLFLVLYTNNYKFIFFFAVYGVDTVLTILHRLWLRQNIFEAHRLHFYQLLANEYRMPHLSVASIYALLQLLVNLFLIHTHFSFLVSGLAVCLPLAIVYIAAKPKMMQRVQ